MKNILILFVLSLICNSVNGQSDNNTHSTEFSETSVMFKNEHLNQEKGYYLYKGSENIQRGGTYMLAGGILAIVAGTTAIISNGDGGSSDFRGKLKTGSYIAGGLSMFLSVLGFGKISLGGAQLKRAHSISNPWLMNK